MYKQVKESAVGFNPMALISKYANLLFMAGAVIAIILIWPWLKKYILNMTASLQDTKEEIQKDKEFKENTDPVVKQSKMDKITTRKDIQADAISLAHDLGTKYSDAGNKWIDWADWSGWTENDAEIGKTLRRQRYNFGLLEKLYYIETRSRNLRSDVLEFLDKDELEKVRQVMVI